ncbi:MAG: hypothetical protein LBL60_00425 [Mycoplasmataceae bacterium]|nr:hypothetical protein [Mycoplasmataceae bacterium]
MQVRQKIWDLTQKEAPTIGIQYKIINTGTINRWGNKELVYDKRRFTYPCANKNDLINTFPTRTFLLGKKIIIASMGSLKLLLDDKSEFFPSMPLLVIYNNEDLLNKLYLLLSSKLLNWYLLTTFKNAGMAGFKLRYGDLENIPIPNLQTINIDSNKIDECVYKAYNLTKEEIEIIEKELI